MREKVTYIDIHGNEIHDYEYQKQKYGTIENDEYEVSKTISPSVVHRKERSYQET